MTEAARTKTYSAISALFKGYPLKSSVPIALDKMKQDVFNRRIARVILNLVARFKPH